MFAFVSLVKNLVSLVKNLVSFVVKIRVLSPSPFRDSVIPLFRHSKNNSRSGAVMMEYVIVAVLIAAACVVGVLVFSRTVARGWAISGTGTTLQPGKTAEMQKKSQEKAREETEVGENYHDTFHD